MFVSKRAVGPLPGGLPVGLGEFAGGVQVVAVHGIGGALDHCRYRQGAAGGGQLRLDLFEHNIVPVGLRVIEPIKFLFFSKCSQWR